MIPERKGTGVPGVEDTSFLIISFFFLGGG